MKMRHNECITLYLRSYSTWHTGDDVQNLSAARFLLWCVCCFFNRFREHKAYINMMGDRTSAYNPKILTFYARPTGKTKPTHTQKYTLPIKPIIYRLSHSDKKYTQNRPNTLIQDVKTIIIIITWIPHTHTHRPNNIQNHIHMLKAETKPTVKHSII